MNKKSAFTLSEILITLAIIGIVASLTIPNLIKNYQDNIYNSARLKALRTFGEAGKMASINGEINSYAIAKEFVNGSLRKYLKITKICDNNKGAECNFPATFKTSTGGTSTSDNIKTWVNLGNFNSSANNVARVSDASLSTYIKTADGFSAKLFYNPNCVRNSHENPYIPCPTKGECSTRNVDAACINIIYDMNGEKTPNHVGEDIGFVTVFWSGLKASSAAPSIISYETNTNIYNLGGSWQPQASARCSALGSKKISYTLASVDELASLYLNKGFTGMPHDDLWSGSVLNDGSGKFWVVGGHRDGGTNNVHHKAWCVRRQ